MEKPFAASAIGVKMNLFISKPFTFFTGKEDTKNKALPPTSHKLNHQHMMTGGVRTYASHSTHILP